MNGKKAYVTAALIVINVIVYFLMSAIGDTENTQFLLSHGAFYYPLAQDGEWWRVFSSMFMHAGLYHLINNMIMLAAVGFTVEEELGSIKYAIVYFVGGIGGTALSVWYEMGQGSYSVDVGASGCIMAVFAALAAVALRNRRNFDKGAGIRMLIVLAIMVFGNMGPGINWMAHLGGAITGLILGFILYRPKYRTN